MKCKLYNIILSIVILGSSVSSCDSYLNVESKSTFTEEVTFSNLDFATKAVLGIYANLASQNFYEYVVGFFFPCDSDIEHVYGNDDGSGRSLARYKADAGNAYIASPWKLLYQTIERANICLDNLPKSPIWEGEYAKEARRLYGEALTLRAMCYFELVRNWGDVPFPIKSFQDGDQYTLPKTDRDEIYEYMIEDLLKAQEYVPSMKEIQTVERISKGFVKGLRARMALAYAGYSLRNKTLETRRGRYWEEYYKIAHQECKEIMESGDYKLNPDYVSIFKNLHAYQMDLQYGESMYEIAFGRLYTGRVGQMLGMVFATNPADPKYGRAAAAFETNPYYYYSFNTKDVRRNVSCELYNYASSSYPGVQRLIGINGWRLTKWRKSWIVPAMGGEFKDVHYTGVNWPLMRYSDVVLMFTETENQINGPTQAAKDALASVRKRAFDEGTWDETITHYIDSVSVNKETFFDAIVNERAWEFGGEMIRKYDLVRWNLLGKKLKQVKEESLKIANNDPKWQNVPNYLYWKYAEDGETIEILNPDYRLPATNVPGYSRTSWMSGVNNKSTLIKLLDDIASGFDETKNNHLFPIASSVITESNGVLTNDQMHDQ